MGIYVYHTMFGKNNYQTVGPKLLRLKQIFAMARINVWFNVLFFDLTSIVNKKVILGIKCKFSSKIIVINTIFVVKLHVFWWLTQWVI